jgi:hypothetical protein
MLHRASLDPNDPEIQRCVPTFPVELDAVNAARPERSVPANAT